jgi:hypothetical protein
VCTLIDNIKGFVQPFLNSNLELANMKLEVASTRNNREQEDGKVRQGVDIVRWHHRSTIEITPLCWLS